jgi:hypothetical protein
MRLEQGQDEVVLAVKLDRLFRAGFPSNCELARRRDAHIADP